MDHFEQVFKELGTAGRERLKNMPAGECSYEQVANVRQLPSTSKTVCLLCKAIHARAEEGHVHHGGNLHYLFFACCRPTLPTFPMNARPAAIRSPGRNSAPTAATLSARLQSPLRANAATPSTRLLSHLPAQRFPEKPSAEQALPTEYGKKGFEDDSLAIDAVRKECKMIFSLCWIHN